MWEPEPPRPLPAHFLQEVFSTAPIYDLIFCDLSPRTLVWLSRTCRRAHEAVTRFICRAYNINRHLSRYFPDPLAFRSLQARTGLVISGSNALQFLDRSFYPESDLDLYAHPGHVYEALEWLDSVGYKFKPESWQQEDWRDEVPADWDGTAKRIDRFGEMMINREPDMVYSDVAGVYTFTRIVTMDTETVTLKVQIIASKCNPIQTITQFHSTCVMNIITFDAAYSFYPVATFEERMAIQIPGSNRLDVVAKYVKRGWRVYAVFGPDHVARSQRFLLNEKRWVGDRHCWSIPLDTTGVTPRPVLSLSSEPFLWDPSTQNGWIMECEGDSPSTYVPNMRTHLVMTTIFRYNYSLPDLKLAKEIRSWSLSQGSLNHSLLSRKNWTWFDAEIPRFRAEFS
ncbi:hypothetical protein CY34DRAFT_310412 [Suillus luteus UH-Slu-Lm8-n1]|uniref:F-box domain-containing protein n=1 Tax=Suillus luteus UH-Slu-Lm8-n1 TaxID=930992 RepID=A0A0D0B5B8_9AGAM|nr:hypothetical protein CY34DRAFT_310412 [Suillus luteus UH-Slu-Lm8-n1]